MLRAALSAPLRSADAAGTLIIGGVLTLCSWGGVVAVAVGVVAAPVSLLALPVTLAPAIIARGYLVCVVARAAETDGVAPAEGATPRFVRWGRLYRDGLKSLCLTAVYLLPLCGFLAVAGLTGALIEYSGVDPGAVVAPLTESVGAFDSRLPTASADTLAYAIGGSLVAAVAAMYLVAYAYVRPAALAVFAATGRLKPSVRPRVALRVARSSGYAGGWAMAVAVSLTGFVLAVPFVPMFFGIIGVFAVRVVTHTLYGRGASEALAPMKRHAQTSASDTATAHTNADAEFGQGPEADPTIQVGRTVTATDGDGRTDRSSRGQSEAKTTRHESEEESESAAVMADDEAFEWGV